MTGLRIKGVAFAAWALFLAAPAALAGTQTFAGDRLILTAGSDADVTIEPDASLSHAIRVTASSDCVKTVEISGQDGPGTVTVSNEACDSDNDTLVIAVSPGLPIIAASHGDGDLRIGNTQGPLTATLSGSGKFTAGRVSALILAIHSDADSTVAAVDGPATIDITGSGDLRLQRLEGPLRSVQRGSGNLVVGALDAPTADVVIQGSGDALLGTGTLGTLHASVSGSGDLGVAATVGNATVEASGGSDVKLSRVTGQLTKNTSGGSDVYTGADLLSFGLGKLATAVSEPDSKIVIDDTPSHRGRTDGGHGGSGVGHVVAGIIVLALLFLIWRSIRRRGGLASLRAQRVSPRANATHPGVIALRDTMGRLDARLAKLEGYVTSREFDLHRKFRELDPQ